MLTHSFMNILKWISTFKLISLLLRLMKMENLLYCTYLVQYIFTKTYCILCVKLAIFCITLRCFLSQSNEDCLLYSVPLEFIGVEILEDAFGRWKFIHFWLVAKEGKRWFHIQFCISQDVIICLRSHLGELHI